MIQKARLSDFGGSSGTAKSSGFNWQAGNLSLQPMSGAPRDTSSVTPVQQQQITQAQQAATTNPAPAQYSQPWQGIETSYGTPPSYQAPAPAPIIPDIPTGPAVGGRQWYEGLGQQGQQAQDAKWLGGDSDYTAQIAEYDKALKSFIDRIANQRKGFTEDATLATQSTERNQDMSLDNLGEDFGARGLSYSGMFDTSKNQTNQRFNEAKAGIERMRSRNDSDAVNREKDYRAENAISRGNAQRASLSRQAQRQALIDSMGAF